MDWNSLLSDDPCLKFTSYTGRYFPDADDLVRYLADFAAATRLRIRYDTRVVRVTRDGGFRAVDQDGRAYEARRLVVATGFSGGRPVLRLCTINPETTRDEVTAVIDRLETLGGLGVK